MKKDYIPLLLFALVPFAFISPGLAHVGHQFFFILSTLAIMGVLIENKWIRTMLVYIAIWQLFLFVSGFLNLDIFFKRMNPQVGQGFGQIAFAISGAIVFKWASESKIKLNVIYNVICVTTIIQMLITAGQINGTDPVFNLLAKIFEAKRTIGITEPVGTLGNSNFFSAYIAISLPFFFRQYWMWFIIPIIAFLLDVNVSTAVFAVLVGIAYYYRDFTVPGYFELKTKWRYAIGIFIIILAGFTYTIAFDSRPFWENDRFEMWGIGLKTVFDGGWENIIFGLGPGAKWGGVGTLHNEWLSTFLHYGIIGLILIGGFALTVFKKNKILFTALIIACVNAMGNLNMHLAPSAFLIIMIAGLCERERRHGRNISAKAVQIKTKPF